MYITYMSYTYLLVYDCSSLIYIKIFYLSVSMYLQLHLFFNFDYLYFSPVLTYQIRNLSI